MVCEARAVLFSSYYLTHDMFQFTMINIILGFKLIVIHSVITVVEVHLPICYDLFCEYLQREKYDSVDKHGSELFYICNMYLRLVVMYVHVPQVGRLVCTCTSGWWFWWYCVHVPQVGSIVCTCTSGW